MAAYSGRGQARKGVVRVGVLFGEPYFFFFSHNVGGGGLGGEGGASDPSWGRLL